MACSAQHLSCGSCWDGVMFHVSYETFALPSASLQEGLSSNEEASHRSWSSIRSAQHLRRCTACTARLASQSDRNHASARSSELGPCRRFGLSDRKSTRLN